MQTLPGRLPNSRAINADIQERVPDGSRSSGRRAPHQIAPEEAREARMEHVDHAQVAVADQRVLAQQPQRAERRDQQTLGRELAQKMLDHHVKPEIEVFDSGHLVFAKELISEGLIEEPALIQTPPSPRRATVCWR